MNRAIASTYCSRRRSSGLSEVMLWDTERPYHSCDGLPIGGCCSAALIIRSALARTDRANSRRRRVRCANTSTRSTPRYRRSASTAWEGLFAMTPDGLPYICPRRRYPKHAFALGYGGNGMTFAALGARILVEQWRGLGSTDHDLFAFNRSR
ncbi:MAG: FAD-dependent oxidoreductase [Acidobacteriota bacterium]